MFLTRLVRVSSASWQPEIFVELPSTPTFPASFPSPSAGPESSEVAVGSIPRGLKCSSFVFRSHEVCRFPLSGPHALSNMCKLSGSGPYRNCSDGVTTPGVVFPLRALPLMITTSISAGVPRYVGISTAASWTADPKKACRKFFVPLSRMWFS